MTQFVPNSYPDFDTDAAGMRVAFRDAGGSHHGLVTYQTSPGGVVRKSNGLAVGELGVGSVIYAQRQHDGYLPANGAVYSRAAYPALRATIGTVPSTPTLCPASVNRRSSR